MTDTPQNDTVLKVPCLIYSRIVGYLTPVQNWNAGKRQEFEDRVAFALPAEDDSAEDDH